MKKPLIPVIVIFLLFIAVTTSHAGDETGIKKEESDLFVHAYAGYGAYFWNPLGGMRADISYNNSPFLMAKIGAEFDYSIFTFGAEYSNSKFATSGITVFKDENNRNKSHLAEQLKIFNGLSYGKYKITVSALYQKYKSGARSHAWQPLNYYTKNDGLITLNSNDAINFYSKYQYYDLSCERIFSKYITGAAGFRYIMFEAPTEVTINRNSNGDDATILLYTKNRLYDPHLDIALKYPVTENFYPQLTLATSLFLMSSYYPENDYFATGYTKPLSADAFQFVGMFGMDFSLHYIREKLKVESGIGFNYSTSSIDYDNIRVKKNIEGYDMLSGNHATFNKGDRVDLKFVRSDFIWGVYAKVSYDF